MFLDAGLFITITNVGNRLIESLLVTETCNILPILCPESTNTTAKCRDRRTELSCGSSGQLLPYQIPYSCCLQKGLSVSFHTYQAPYNSWRTPWQAVTAPEAFLSLTEMGRFDWRVGMRSMGHWQGALYLSEMQRGALARTGQENGGKTPTLHWHLSGSPNKSRNSNKKGLPLDLEFIPTSTSNPSPPQIHTDETRLAKTFARLGGKRRNISSSKASMLPIMNLHGTTKSQLSTTDHNRSFSPKLLYPCTKIHTGQPFQVGPELSTTSVHGATLDISEAYTRMPIRPNLHRYLAFSYRHQLYFFQALPFGLNLAPYIFTKIMDWPLQTLRMQDVNIMAYLDDIILWQSSAETIRK